MIGSAYASSTMIMKKSWTQQFSRAGQTNDRGLMQCHPYEVKQKQVF